MNKHTKTYLLLGLVMLVWSLIGFKLLSAFSPDPEPHAVVENMAFKPQKRILKDTFSILTAYRDPFLGTLNRFPKKKSSPRKKKKPILPQFPPITYTGLMGNPQGKSPIFFVTIAGNTYLMQKGDTNDGVTLARGTDTNLSIRYKGRPKTIPLQDAAP